MNNQRLITEAPFEHPANYSCLNKHLCTADRRTMNNALPQIMRERSDHVHIRTVCRWQADSAAVALEEILRCCHKLWLFLGFNLMETRTRRPSVIFMSNPNWCGSTMTIKVKIKHSSQPIQYTYQYYPVLLHSVFTDEL